MPYPGQRYPGPRPIGAAPLIPLTAPGHIIGIKDPGDHGDELRVAGLVPPDSKAVPHAVDPALLAGFFDIRVAPVASGTSRNVGPAASAGTARASVSATARIRDIVFFIWIPPHNQLSAFRLSIRASDPPPAAGWTAAEPGPEASFLNCICGFRGSVSSCPSPSSITGASKAAGRTPTHDLHPVSARNLFRRDRTAFPSPSQRSTMAHPPSPGYSGNPRKTGRAGRSRSRGIVAVAHLFPPRSATIGSNELSRRRHVNGVAVGAGEQWRRNRRLGSPSIFSESRPASISSP